MRVTTKPTEKGEIKDKLATNAKTFWTSPSTEFPLNITSAEYYTVF